MWVLRGFKVSFEITKNQQATLSCNEQQVAQLVEVLIHSGAKLIEVTLDMPTQVAKT